MSYKKAMQGESLLEVLVALFIFSISILGIGMSCLQYLQMTREVMNTTFILMEKEVKSLHTEENE